VLAHEIDGLLGIREQQFVADGANCTVPVLLLTGSGVQATQHTEFTFDRGANRVRAQPYRRSDINVVLVTARRLGIRLERTVHHHAGITLVQSGPTSSRAVAMILVDAYRNGGEHLFGRLDHLADHRVTGVGTCTTADLQDHRRVYGGCRAHDRDDLLHVVDVKRR
jgi:hypothetical protein